MAQFDVFISGNLYINARVEVEAATEDEAKELALEQARNNPESIEWIDLDNDGTELPRGTYPQGDTVVVDWVDGGDLDLPDEGVGSEFIEY